MSPIDPVRFTVTLHREGATGVAMVLPIDVRAVFGRHRPPVRVRINGYEWRSTPARYGDDSFIVVNRAAQAGAGVGVGDEVEVDLELDTEPRTVAVPDDLAVALAARDADASFDAMSFSHRREYVEWIEEAKRAETRRRRIDQTVERVRTGRPQR